MSVCICTPRQLNTGRRAKRCEAHTGYMPTTKWTYGIPIKPAVHFVRQPSIMARVPLSAIYDSEERGALIERADIAAWLSGACDNTFPPTLWSLLKQLGTMVARGDYRPVKSVKKKKKKR